MAVRRVPVLILTLLLAGCAETHDETHNDSFIARSVEGIGKAAREAASHRDQKRFVADLQRASGDTWKPWTERLASASGAEQTTMLRNLADDCDRLVTGGGTSGGFDWSDMLTFAGVGVGVGLVLGHEVAKRRKPA